MKRTALENWICAAEGLSALDRAGLEALQLERLNGVLRREKERGGFYRGLPEKLTSLSELSSLPFTTASELREKGGAMLLCSQSETARVITERTSGTEGPAKRVFYTDRDCRNTVGFFAAGISELAGPGDRVMIAMPFSGGLGLGELIAAAVESLGAAAIRAGVGLSYGEFSDILRRDAPNVYIGMPVPLLSLLRFFGGETSIERALVSGDACPLGVTEATEKLLGSRLFPHYGSREMGLGGAVTCEVHEGMHLRENHIIAEIVDAGGRPLPDGDWGELVVSTVGMEALPLLRYRTGDRARLLPGPCPCGGVTKRLEVSSRLPAGPDMAELDSALFRLPGLADYSAELREGKLRLDALGATEASELEATARGLWPELEVSAVCSAPVLSDRPKYLGKRKIKTEP